MLTFWLLQAERKIETRNVKTGAISILMLRSPKIFEAGGHYSRTPVKINDSPLAVGH